MCVTRLSLKQFNRQSPLQNDNTKTFSPLSLFPPRLVHNQIGEENKLKPGKSMLAEEDYLLMIILFTLSRLRCFGARVIVRRRILRVESALRRNGQREKTSVSCQLEYSC